MSVDETFEDRRLDYTLGGKRITLADFLASQRHLLAILKEIDVLATKREGGSLDFIIDDLRGGSASVNLIAEPKGEDTPVWAPGMVVNRFKTGIRHVIETGQRPEGFNEAAMRHAFDLTTILNVNGIEAFRVRLNGESVSLLPEMRKHVQEAKEGRHRALGSLEGRVEQMSVHGEGNLYYCTAYSFLSNEAVQCSFEPDLYARVHRYFGQPVVIRGVFNTRPNGEVTSMRMESIDLLLSDDELPTVEDLIGLFVDEA